MHELVNEGPGHKWLWQQLRTSAGRHGGRYIRVVPLVCNASKLVSQVGSRAAVRQGDEWLSCRPVKAAPRVLHEVGLVRVQLPTPGPGHGRKHLRGRPGDKGREESGGSEGRLGMQCGSTGCAHTGGGGGTLHGIANTRPSARTSRVRCRPMPFSLCAGRRSSPRNPINNDSCRHTHTHTHRKHGATPDEKRGGRRAWWHNKPGAPARGVTWSRPRHWQLPAFAPSGVPRHGGTRVPPSAQRLSP